MKRSRLTKFLRLVLAVSVATHPLGFSSFISVVKGQDQGEGKLFTTAYEREYLDYLRRNFLAERAASGFNIENVPPPIIIDDQETTVTQEAAPVLYNLGGIIQRAENNRTVWLNNRLVPESELPANLVIIDTPQGPVLQINDQGRSYRLKPGQTLNMSTGDILESFQVPVRETRQPPRQSGALILPSLHEADNAVSTSRYQQATG